MALTDEQRKALCDAFLAASLALSDPLNEDETPVTNAEVDAAYEVLWKWATEETQRRLKAKGYGLGNGLAELLGYTRPTPDFKLEGTITGRIPRDPNLQTTLPLRKREVPNA